MKARLLKATKNKELLDHISENLELYRSGNFDFLVSDPTCYFESDLEIDCDKLISIDCDEHDHNEVKNCMLILEAMGDLAPYMARDERVWVYLTHTYLLDYTRKRWPIPADDEKAINHIRTHFFVIGARGVERDNSASRLWWMASLCSRVDGLSLEEALTCLLHQYDVRANIIERPTTSQSIHVFSTILKMLNESYKGDKSLFEREKFRSVMKQLNLKGGVKLLDILDEKNVQGVFLESI